MRVVRTIAELRQALAPTRTSSPGGDADSDVDHTGQASGGVGVGAVGLVPTMGALHAGHLSLAQAAREQNQTVVMSIFVNPTQFNEASDLAAYPRDEERDLDLAAQAGVDIVFSPSAQEMYPDGFATTVRVDGPLAEVLEGAQRGRGHFDGVATVVTKLLLAAQPQRAYFGAKDAQQALVVRRVVADLNIPTQIVVAPTFREDDGLAMSSRNVHLDPHERGRAASLHRALQQVVAAAQAGERDVERLCGPARQLLNESRVEVEYLTMVDRDSLEELTVFDRPALVVVAGRVGATRLIDNVSLEPLA